MGGRGSVSYGARRAPKGYSTTGRIRGYDVLQDKKTGRGLPLKGPANGGYYRRNRNGNITQFRRYDHNGMPRKDIDTGHDHGQGDPHVHEWINGIRSVGRKPDADEIKQILFK